MTDREAMIAFNMVEGIGMERLKRLLDRHEGDAVAAYENLAPSAKKTWAGIEPDWQREIETADRHKVKIVTWLDEEYPQQLRAMQSAPVALYISGDVAALSKPSVAIVGTRIASLYGTDIAYRFSMQLAERGWAVVSGLATGIDAFAHKGALAGKGVTVGVLGSALNEFFPEENRMLARKMVGEGGAVVSEFPFGRKPDRKTFPQRNRIVAALSSGVVAVECPLKSGTIITTSFAADYGLPVMAVPGRIDSRLSAGCNNLIREGARMVTSIEDVIEELSNLPVRMDAPAPKGKRNRGGMGSDEAAVKDKKETPKPAITLSGEEARIIGLVGEDGISVDELIRSSGINAGKINGLLVGLKLKHRLRFLPGNRVGLEK